MSALTDSKQKTASRKIASVTILSIAANVVLFAIKFLVGFLTGSVALVADGIHSISDLATDVGVILGVRLGSKEPDMSHPYGHGRAETFSAVFISLFLIFVGGGMVYYAARDIAQGNVVKPQISILLIAVISMIVKEFLYWITRLAAVKYNSAALYANAWHHRSDALSSVAVAVGFIALKFGFSYGDQLAAVTVGVMIMFVAIKIMGQCVNEFAERAVDADTYEHIKNIINSNHQIHHWHKLRTRTIAREIFLDLHILVDSNLDIKAAHQIAEDLENNLHEQLSRPVNITVHVEPDIPELRK
ncbi:MAG: cation diffusion facilitator family transporter [Phycisphaerae bacterium]